jgi:hypothetical protein
MTPRDPSAASVRRYVRLVRATLQLDDDVLEAARCIADDEHASVGEILSRLARRGLDPRPDEPAWNRLPPSMTRRPPSVTRGGALRRLGLTWKPW